MKMVVEKLFVVEKVRLFLSFLVLWSGAERKGGMPFTLNFGTRHPTFT
jgi:hypothetical protein